MPKLAQLSNLLLRSSWLWGTAITVALYSPMGAPLWRSTFVERFVSGHPVLPLQMLLFFTAAASLSLRAGDMLNQCRTLRAEGLGPIVPGGQPVDTCETLLGRLMEQGSARQEHYRTRRLRQVLECIANRGGAESIDRDLARLAALDRWRMLASYAPIGVISLVMLSVALAITLDTIAPALVSAAPPYPANRAQTLPQLATALAPLSAALCLVACLVVGLMVAISLERRLLKAVDHQVASELVGRFQQVGSIHDPHLLAVRRMADAVVQVTERLVHRQAELWQSTLEAAQSRWNHDDRESPPPSPDILPFDRRETRAA